MVDKTPMGGLKYLIEEFRYSWNEFREYLIAIALPTLVLLGMAIYGRHDKDKGSAKSTLEGNNPASKSRVFQKYAAPNHEANLHSTYILGKPSPGQAYGLPFLGKGYETIDSKFLN